MKRSYAFNFYRPSFYALPIIIALIFLGRFQGICAQKRTAPVQTYDDIEVLIRDGRFDEAEARLKRMISQDQMFNKAISIDGTSEIAKRTRYAIEFMRNNADSRYMPDFSFIDREYRD